MKSKDNMSYYLGFSHCLGIGPMKFDSLVKHFGGVKAAYEAKPRDLNPVLGIRLASQFEDFRKKFDPAVKLEEYKRKNILTLSREDDRFPRPLKEIADAPICIYVKGDIQNFDWLKDYFFAVVGTRRPTAYGQQITKMFTSELAASGFVIVSGLAMGVDAAAHWAALENGGRTIAVLGCGVDLIYPPSNKKLYEEIIDCGSLVISEFPPGMTTLPGLFVARNRLVSGLSRGVLVVEGTNKSGSLITARCAAEQGKEVFAPPVPLTSEMSEAPNILLKQGAKLVTSPADISEEFNLKLVPLKRKELDTQLTDNEKRIFELIFIEPRQVDEIIVGSALTINAVLNVLSILEIKGVIEKNAEGKYQIKI